nr:CreA family protein [Thiorhodovibrio winogradskyi]
MGLAAGLSVLLLAPSSLWAERIGEVSTKFKLVGPNDKVVIEVFQDPDIPGVACYLSRAETGGMSGAVGLAEDTSDASLACRQVGPVSLPEDIASGKRNGDEVFKKRISLLTKTMQVVRFYDAPRNTLVYLSYSDRIIEGSPKNSTSVVVIRPWSGADLTGIQTGIQAGADGDL